MFFECKINMSICFGNSSYEKTLGRQTVCCTYVFSTCITVLRVKGLKAVAAVWSSIFHDVALAAEGGLTLVAAEVLHVPVSALCLGAFISKDYLCDPDIIFISKDTLHRESRGLDGGGELM